MVCEQLISLLHNKAIEAILVCCQFDFEDIGNPQLWSSMQTDDSIVDFIGFVCERNSHV